VEDLTAREWATVAPLLLAIVAIGFWPQPLLSAIKEPVDGFVSRVSSPSKIMYPTRPQGAGTGSGEPTFAPAPGGNAIPPQRLFPPRAPMAQPPPGEGPK
jgi:hypothetical protein